MRTARASSWRRAFLRGGTLRKLGVVSTPSNPYGQEPYDQAPQGAGAYGQPQASSQGPYIQNPYAQSPYAQSPYGQGQSQAPYAYTYQGQTQGQPAAGVPYGPAYPVQAPMNTLSIVSLVCAFVFAPAGLVCGIIALSQIKKKGERGKGMAIAGVVISALSLLLFVLLFVFAMVVAATTSAGIMDAYSQGDLGSGYSYEYDYGDPGDDYDFDFGDTDPSDPYDDGSDDGGSDDGGMQVTGWVVPESEWPR